MMIDTRREPPAQERIKNKSNNQSTKVPEVVLRFKKDAYHLAEEWFSVEDILPQVDGSWLVKKAYPDDEWLYRFILGLKCGGA